MARFHPDGLILAIGCAAESAVEIYDIKSLDLVTRFKADGESTAVTSLEFSENGYFLASATASAVHIWDLRSQALYAEIKPPVEADDTGDFRVQWDGFGAYLAVFGRGKQAFVWRNKQWKEDPVAAWDIGARGLGCAFTGDAEMVVFAGSDGKYSVLS
jgi:WD40 repeat protein